MANPDELRCQELVELVTEYLDGALSATERVRFDAHLLECDPCVEYIDQVKVTVGVVGRLSEDELTAPVREHLLAHFRAWKRSPNGTSAEPPSF